MPSRNSSSLVAPTAPMSATNRAKAAAAANMAAGGMDGKGSGVSTPRSAGDRRKALAGAALGEMEIQLSKLTSLIEAQQASIWAQAQTLKDRRREERTAAATPASKNVHQLHKSRSLSATSAATRTLLWMQQQLIGCRILKKLVVERLESAWLLVGRENVSAHLLDVLENRIKHVDQVAMQNLIDVETNWLLGKAAPAKRTGGGYQRNNKGKLMQETDWLHNMEVRHMSLSQGARSSPVPPPTSPGLRAGAVAGRSTTSLWPDASPIMNGTTSSSNGHQTPWR